MGEEIYDYRDRLERYRRIIGRLRNGELALGFLDHLSGLGLSLARVSKYASHLPSLLRMIDFNLARAGRAEIECVVAGINRKPWKESTKLDMRLVLRKLVQYAKYGRCDRETPVPPEASWIKLTSRRKAEDSRVTPEALLTREEFEKLVKAADNSRDKALLYTLLEGALRPNELLTMNVGWRVMEDERKVVMMPVKGLKPDPLNLRRKIVAKTLP